VYQIKDIIELLEEIKYDLESIFILNQEVNYSNNLKDIIIKNKTK
jgi:hypothetical protein